MCGAVVISIALGLRTALQRRLDRGALLALGGATSFIARLAVVWMVESGRR
jgi:hypothetical protein